MRRLWSYIILAFTTIFLVGASFAEVFKKASGNIEYLEGREMVFRIEKKDDDTRIEDLGELGAADEVVETMIERLESSDISNYQISVQGDDTISVTLSQDYASYYQNIETLLSFNGSLALSTKQDEVVIEEKDHFLDFSNDQEAYLETVNNYPTVNIPVHYDAIQEIVKIVKDASSNDTDQDRESYGEQTSQASEETEATYGYYLYLWHDFIEDQDTYAKATGGEDSKAAQKIFMTFDAKEIEEDATFLRTFINIKDANGDGEYTADDVERAYTTAKFYINLINSGDLNYEVTFLYDKVASPIFNDEVLTIAEEIKWSQTLIASIVIILVVSVILAMLYRLGALSVIACSLATLLGGIGAMVLLTAEFNTAGIIALIVLGISSIASGIIYLQKTKEELYRGRTLKKANSEAAKRSLLPIIDVNVASILVGVFAYVLGGAVMRTYAVIVVLGGLVSLLCNTLGLRGMMWLLSNTTGMQGNFELALGVSKEQVPNILKEEKQSYFGPYADKDFTKKNKPASIISGGLFVIGLAAMIVFGVVNKGSVFNSGAASQNSKIYFETTAETTLMNPSRVEELLKGIKLISENEVNPEDKSLFDHVDSFDEATRSEVVETKEIKYYYVVANLTSEINNEQNAYYVDPNDSNSVLWTSATSNLSDLLQTVLNDYVDSEGTVSVKTSTLVSANTPVFTDVCWGVLLGVGVASIYLMLRYKLSRGLASFVAPVITSVAITGLFALVRIPVGSYAVLALPAIAVFTLIVSIIFMNRERELVLEDKKRDNSIENRQAIMKTATSSAMAPISLVALISGFMFFAFFGFGASGIAWLCLIIVIGIAFATYAVATCYGSFSMLVAKFLNKTKIDTINGKFKRKKNVRKNATNKNSAEPEEYTFIGINEL